MRSKKNLSELMPAPGDSFDVIVAGGGPAGLGAAAASAKQGAKTLLLEARAFPGGVSPLAPWMPINRLFLNGGSRGVHQLFTDALAEYEADAAIPGRINKIDGDNLNTHPEYFKLAACRVLEDLGCSYRFHSQVTGVTKDGQSIQGVQVGGKRGIEEFFAHAIVDATGDADVAFFAGADMVTGRETDGGLMFVSLCFALANCDVEAFYASDGWRNTVSEAACTGKYRMARWYGPNRTTIPGVIGINNGGPVDAGDIDATDAAALTLVERMGLEVALDFVRIARDFQIPGLGECHLMRTGAAAAVRETRRIVGDYVLTLEDCCEGVEFDDLVARRYGAVDPAGADSTKGIEMVSGHSYPYRSMLPKGIEGLLVAGRCASTTHMGQTAGKSMGNMMDLGQAAGVAAALAARRRITPRALEVSIIQKALVDMGVPLFP
ncbi:MAG: FAD-dependent oxidoreductase [Spirochaetales bacterium]|nr:FAD-dependent oxidoreductase [Spirochaetales bacterium]